MIKLKYFPFIGISGIFITLICEFVLFDGDISGPASVLLLTFIFWIAYPFISNKFVFERDFSFGFLNLVSIFYTLPYVLLKISTGTLGEKTPQLFRDDLVFYLLALPLTKILNIFGYLAWAQGDRVFFEDLEINLINSVGISTGCSGTYSTLIFICALFSYIYTIKFSDKNMIILFCILGILISYTANLFRMFVIVLFGHYYGIDALRFAHANVGWILFTTWILLFWFFIDKYVNSYNTVEVLIDNK